MTFPMTQGNGGRSLLILLLLAVAPILPTHAYASWLKCYVDLDESEVIMNRPVKTLNDAPHVVSIQVALPSSQEWQSHFTYPQDTLTQLQVSLKVPPALQEEDVQFVVETTAGAVFTSPVMCQGKRSFSRAYNQPVTLVIDGSQPTLSLVAGWATGFEAVSLTETLVLTRLDGDIHETHSDEEVEDSDGDESEEEEVGDEEEEEEVGDEEEGREEEEEDTIDYEEEGDEEEEEEDGDDDEAYEDEEDDHDDEL